MGLPWPPTWEGGASCAICEDVIFSGVTPIFVYAFAQDIVKCAGVPPDVPDPNHVIRMSQIPLNACSWEGHSRTGVFDYSYVYFFTGGKSTMYIIDISGMPIFSGEIAANCQDHFTNDLICGPPFFPGFSGGTVDCFWGF